MSKTYVRIKEGYHKANMIGQTAVLIEMGTEFYAYRALIGFPLDSPFGWYDEDMSTSYNLWYISEEYLELVKVFSHNKFK
jgi:hypothetical protein